MFHAFIEMCLFPKNLVLQPVSGFMYKTKNFFIVRLLFYLTIAGFMSMNLEYLLSSIIYVISDEWNSFRFFMLRWKSCICQATNGKTIRVEPNLKEITYFCSQAPQTLRAALLSIITIMIFLYCTVVEPIWLMMMMDCCWYYHAIFFFLNVP